MTNNTIHFEVVNEAFTHRFTNFNEAKAEYNALRESGLWQTSLRRVCEGEKTVYWSDRFCAFMG